MVRKTGGTLSPVSHFDAEELASFPEGMLFDLVARNKRTLPLHRTYWTCLLYTSDAADEAYDV